MGQYLVRRMLQMIPILIGVSIVIFIIFDAAPGNYIDSQNNPNLTAEREAKLRELYGLDKPLVPRYLTWAGNAFRGQLGDSLKYKRPVVSVIKDHIWNSFTLSASAFVLSTLIAIPIGVVSATKQYSIFDSVFTVIALIGISLPSFFFGLLLIKFFALPPLQLLPVSGMTRAGSLTTGIPRMLEVLRHMILPLTVLTFMNVGGLMRFTRTSVLEVIRQDYIRTARAKGLNERVVIYKHALRNAMIPIITILAMSLPSLFAGAIITERIFAWPGIGSIAFSALQVRDYPFLMGFNMFMALLTLLGNLIADISYAMVDPRIRLR
jgi:peptide/nickel transport system permease protein